jgi:adenylate kinase family enzyme
VQRVAIVGPVGSGKSTLARDLAAFTSLPCIDLDDLFWRDGAIPTDAEWAAKHATVIAADRWIIDGDYRGTAVSRFARADTVIWLDPGPVRCAWRILSRHRKGYPAPLRDCLRWTWRYPRHGKRETRAMLAAVGSNTTVEHLRRRGDRARLLERVSRKA